MKDLPLVQKIAQRVHEHGGRLLLVGGYARDRVLRQHGIATASKDIDAEVYGVSVQQLLSLLADFGEVDTVGASFGVMKLKHTQIDISVPRRDSKMGAGHTGFAVNTDPFMSVRDAARRRDFTINSVSIDPLTDELIDPFHGVQDIMAGVLRATDTKLFADDSLRVLRAMQFAARFNMTIDAKTAQLCQSLALDDLPPERIGEEWKKLLLKSDKPSVGLRVAHDLKILEKLHPMFARLDAVPQDPKWHPEGSVWEHTLLSVDMAAQIARRDSLSDAARLELMLATLCHDLGKATTTQITSTGITSYGHETAGLEPTAAFLSQLAMPHHYHSVVTKLVANHMFPLLETEPSDAALRRLALRLHPSTIEQVLRLAEADMLGRTGNLPDTTHLTQMQHQAESLHISATKPEPIILGRDLLALGVKPGKGMGNILNRLYEDQLNGAFSSHTEGMSLVTKYIETQRNN